MRSLRLRSLSIGTTCAAAAGEALRATFAAASGVATLANSVTLEGCAAAGAVADGFLYFENIVNAPLLVRPLWLDRR